MHFSQEGLRKSGTQLLNIHESETQARDTLVAQERHIRVAIWQDEWKAVCSVCVPLPTAQGRGAGISLGKAPLVETHGKHHQSACALGTEQTHF